MSERDPEQLRQWLEKTKSESVSDSEDPDEFEEDYLKATAYKSDTEDRCEVAENVEEQEENTSVEEQTP